MTISLQDTEVWQHVDRQRTRVYELIADLSPTEWTRPSLCTGWTVKDVVGHLTMPGLGVGRLLPFMLRHPGSTNHMIKHVSIDLANRWSPEDLLERLWPQVGLHRHFPGLTGTEMLIDIIGHGFDIALPLGRDLDADPEAVAISADRVLGYGGRGNARVFRSLPLQGFRLVATDHAWHHGEGPEVTGAMADLFLLLTGRTARVSALGGQGAPDLRRAVST